MQRCPQCGYREGTDWPGILGTVSVATLYCVFILGDVTPPSLRLLGLIAYLVFLAGTWWRVSRDKRNREEYLKPHPSVTERVKDHIRVTPDTH